MSDLQALLAQIQCVRQDDKPTFWATVVDTRGSTYHRPGARMFVTAGQAVGMISGGCLEQDILEHTLNQHDEAVLLTYDSTSENEEILWGLGLGCSGVVQVLVQRFAPWEDWHLTEFFQTCLRSQQPGILATVFKVDGSADVKSGDYFMLFPDGRTKTVVKTGPTLDAIAFDTKTVQGTASSATYYYQLSSGHISVLIEAVQPPPHLTVFGAGQDAVPVVQFAKALGWSVTVVDCRARLETTERFAAADTVVLAHFVDIQAQIAVDANSLAVVMTHNYLDDLEVLRFLLPQKIQYVGILGPRRRTDRLLQELWESLPIPQLSTLYSPIGLDIGADTPAEIAVAIIAEIKAVLAGRKGESLRTQLDSIHPPHATREKTVAESAFQSS